MEQSDVGSDTGAGEMLLARRRRVLEAYRVRSGLSLRAACREAGVALNTWRRFVLGETVPWDHSLERMRVAVGVPLPVWDGVDGQMWSARTPEGEEVVFSSSPDGWGASRALMVRTARGECMVVDPNGEVLHDGWSAEVAQVADAIAGLGDRDRSVVASLVDAMVAGAAG